VYLANFIALLQPTNAQLYTTTVKVKGKVIPLQAHWGPEGG